MTILRITSTRNSISPSEPGTSCQTHRSAAARHKFPSDAMYMAPSTPAAPKISNESSVLDFSQRRSPFDIASRRGRSSTCPKSIRATPILIRHLPVSVKKNHGIDGIHERNCGRGGGGGGGGIVRLVVDPPRRRTAGLSLRLWGILAIPHHDAQQAGTRGNATCTQVPGAVRSRDERSEARRVPAGGVEKEADLPI